MTTSKKRLILALSISAVIIIAIAVTAYIFCIGEYASLAIDAERCEAVFGCSPAEFLSSDTDFPSEVECLKDSAEISGDGDLILNFTYLQLNALRKSEWINAYDGLVRRQYVEVFDNNTAVTVYYTDEVKRYNSDRMKELEQDLAEVICKIRFCEQLFSLPGKETDYNTITFRVRDGQSREVLYVETLTASESEYDIVSFEPFIEQNYLKITLTRSFAELLFGVESDEEDKTSALNEQLLLYISRNLLYSFDFDENDHAVIHMSPMQRESLKTYFIGETRSLAEEHGFVISDDFTKVIIEEDGKFTLAELLHELFYSGNVLGYCTWIQILDGIKEEEVLVDYIVGPEDDPFYTAAWPKEEIDFEYNAHIKPE